MGDSMLAIADNEGQRKRKAVPNLLPCHIHHTGPVDSMHGYWAPGTKKDGPIVAFFRGRELHGRIVPVPDECQGLVVQREPASKKVKLSEVPGQDEQEGKDDKDTTANTDTENLQATACFDHMCVWSHETVANFTDDEYMRALGEWLYLAGKINSYPDPDEALKSWSQS
ncbi:hypothetical protein XA68_16404 [Ophiocordyceps unilateralis]|uniref:Uncharacterized protein n=1 Tax=Ophiocordyceps unilateralis TaxID=268505 RepID=A0A2A9P6E1_OPHUN|nr:hypothetical protein XA68_16404 [Ophiocordyceps unilateralis]